MNIVMLITSLIIIAVCYWEAQSAAKPNKNIILGVMIPPLELSNMEVTKITKEFMYSIKILSVLAIVVHFPLMFIRTVWLLIGWFLWFALFYYIYYKVIVNQIPWHRFVKQLLTFEFLHLNFINHYFVF